MQFDYYDLILIPLTPIHIGGGPEELLELEDYRLSKNEKFLERIDIQKYILEMDNSERILKDLQRDLWGTLSRVRESIPAKNILDRISISGEVCNELKPIFYPQPHKISNRQGSISAFQRTGGQPFIPGSSIKGCLRTAWLAKHIKQSGLKVNSNDYKIIEKEAFVLTNNKTESDPFRDLVVNDTKIPNEATKVDKISSWKFDRNKKAYSYFSGIQINRERLISVIDGEKPPILTLRVGIRSDYVHEHRKNIEQITEKNGIEPKASPRKIEDLLSALDSFHYPLWEDEINKFFPNHSNRLNQSLALFDKFRSRNNQPVAGLLRLGWSSHGEAKSVAKYLNKKHPEGKTRQVVRLPSGSPASFGWGIVILRHVWEKEIIENWLPKNVEKIFGRYQFKKGDKVVLEDGSVGVLEENVVKNQDEVLINIDGDQDKIYTSEIRDKRQI